MLTANARYEEAGLDPVVTPVAVAALGELIATAITASAGSTWGSLRRTPEARAVKTAINSAVTDAFKDAVLLTSTSDADEKWVAEVARMWRPAFATREVTAELVACIGDPSRGRTWLQQLTQQALRDAGCDLVALHRMFWLEEFVSVLPRLLFDALTDVARQDDKARGLVDHLLRQRADSRAAGVDAATPREFRHDLSALLQRLENEARTARLPSYLPANVDVTALSRTVRVRRGIRGGPPAGHAELGGRETGRAYQLPAERAGDDNPPRSWPDVAAKHKRLVVLADPGLGKSWLVRTETQRLAVVALACLHDDPAALLIPLPVRCDQLAAAVGQDMADRAVDCLASRGLLPERSRGQLAAMVRAGEVVLLLDALDEVAAGEQEQLRDLVRSWAGHAGDCAQCVITSRIAGYTGSPLPGAAEVELQGFTSADVVAVIDAWQLPPSAADRLRDRSGDPAVAAMARIPLLLALLCALSAELPAGQALPRTRGQLYERVLRWFLTREHRRLDNPGGTALDDVAIDALLGILAPLAFSFATSPQGWTDLMRGNRLLNAVRAVGPAFTEMGRPAAEVLRELTVGAGVLVPDCDPSAGRSPNYLFLHRTFAEYLVARHLATLSQADWLAIVEEHRWFDPDWDEVLPMLSEQLSPSAARSLIGHFLGDEADPFHHALLTAFRLWGEREDADRLLPAEQAAELTERAERLIRHQTVRLAVVSQMTTMAYLPSSLLALLVTLLADGDKDVQQAASEALTGRGNDEVTEGLLNLLKDEKNYGENYHVDYDQDYYERYDENGDDASVRQAAVEALTGRQGARVTEQLLAASRDESWHVRSAAVRALAGREGSEVTDALLDLLYDHDGHVQREAVEALAGRRGAEMTEGLLDLLGHNDIDARRAVIEVLSERPGGEVTQRLLDLLGDHSRLVRAEAADALVGRHGAGVTHGLLGLLADHDDVVRWRAVRALAGRPGAEVTERLLDLLDDHDWEVRREVVEALAERQGAKVTDRLLDLLDDHDRFVRVAAVKALAGRPGSEITERLLDMPGHHDWEVRTSAAWALSRRQGAEVTHRLLDLLGDDHHAMRAAAIGALAGRPGSEITERLLDMPGDHHEEVRREAAKALAGRQGPRVTERLLDLLGDHHSFVREVVVEALAWREDPQDLLALAEGVRNLNRPYPPEVVEAANRLMTRHYLHIPAAERPAIRAAMGWLTATVITGYTDT
jgi:HEAT repeat protein